MDIRICIHYSEIHIHYAEICIHIHIHMWISLSKNNIYSYADICISIRVLKPYLYLYPQPFLNPYPQPFLNPYPNPYPYPIPDGDLTYQNQYFLRMRMRISADYPHPSAPLAPCDEKQDGITSRELFNEFM